MPNTRDQVAKVVYSGTLGTGSNPGEIWSTSLWVAAYGEGGTAGSPNDLSSFDAADYIANHALQFGYAFMQHCPDWVKMTLVKCNVFDIVANKVHQVTDPTVESVQSRAGGAGSSVGPTFVTAFGWALGSTTGTRGLAVKGRMFLPPMAEATGSNGPFDGDGHWNSDLVSAISTGLTSAWDNLAAPTGVGGITYLPSLVSTPTATRPSTTFLVNSADITTAESNVWVVRSRKNALATGGVTTDHPSFA